MKRNHKTLLFAGLVLLFASLALAAFILQPSATELLTQAIETMEGVSHGHAIVELEVDTPEQSGHGVVEMWAKLDAGPNGEPAYRIEVLEASEADAVGIAAVSDGEQLWIWRPIENTVYWATVAELRELMASKVADGTWAGDHWGEYSAADIPETAEEAVAKLLGYFVAERTETEDVGDTAAYTVRLVPIPDAMPEEMRAAGGFVNLWIAVENKAPVAIEYAESQVGVYGKAAATTLELNSDVDETLFNFEMPEDATVINLVELAQAEATEKSIPLDFEMLSPTSLPASSTLVETAEVRGVIVQRYALANGGSFTVAQGPADINYQPDGIGTATSVRGTNGTLYTDVEGSRTLLSWTEGDVSFWVGGDLTAEEAHEVAESLR